jgi:hypothetical protein
MSQPQQQHTRRRGRWGEDGTRVCYPARIGYSSVRTPGTITAAVSLAGWHADVAQLVEHHLAKVRVAGSNPVVRSETPNAVGADPRLSGSMVSLLRWSFGRWERFRGGVAEWFRQGPAKPCTRVRFPSPPLLRSSRFRGDYAAGFLSSLRLWWEDSAVSRSIAASPAIAARCLIRSGSPWLTRARFASSQTCP